MRLVGNFLVFFAFCFSAVLCSSLQSLSLFTGEPGSFLRVSLQNGLLSRVEIHSEKLFIPQPCRISASLVMDFPMVFWPIPQSGLAFIVQTDSNNETVVYTEEYQVQVNREFPLVKPSSVEEGKKYCTFYNEHHHSRGLSFSSLAKGEKMEKHIFIKTIARSGSHVFTNTLEEILGEFIAYTMQPHLKKSEIEEIPIIEKDFSHTYLVWDHHLNDELKKHSFLKIIQTLRDPIEFFDSFFHLKTTKNHTFKFPDSLLYWEHPLFLTFLDFHFLNVFHAFDFIFGPETQSNLKYFVRYEDLVTDPTKTTTDVLSFALSAPINRTAFGIRAKNRLKEGSLSTHFRKNVTHNRGNENWINLMKKYSLKSTQKIYHYSYGWLELFGYMDRWNEFFETGSVENSLLQPFDFIYQKVNEMALEESLSLRFNNYKCTPKNKAICAESGYGEKPPGLHSLGEELQRKTENYLKAFRFGKKMERQVVVILNQKFEDGSLEREMKEIASKSKQSQ